MGKGNVTYENWTQLDWTQNQLDTKIVINTFILVVNPLSVRETL